MQVLVSDAYPVNLERIATPRERLLKFRLGTIDPITLAEAQRYRFDDAPVVDDDDRFAGIIPVSRVESLAANGLPIDSQDPEIYEHPIRDQEPLLKFLDEIATHRAAVIRDTDNEQDGDWFAMVTKSDLNRHSFRAYLYPILAELEASLAGLVDSVFPDPRDWILTCTEERQVHHFGQWQVAVEKGVETSPVISCTLMDLVNIVAKSPSLWPELGYRSRRTFEKATSPLRDLRNKVMHPVRPMILAQEDVIELHDELKAAIDLSQRVYRFAESVGKPVMGSVRIGNLG